MDKTKGLSWSALPVVFDLICSYYPFICSHSFGKLSFVSVFMFLNGEVLLPGSEIGSSQKPLIMVYEVDLTELILLPTGIILVIFHRQGPNPLALVSSLWEPAVKLKMAEFFIRGTLSFVKALCPISSKLTTKDCKFKKGQSSKKLKWPYLSRF